MIIYCYFPINILFRSFPKEDSYSLTIVCDSNNISNELGINAYTELGQW